jgi:hypothetical protein
MDAIAIPKAASPRACLGSVPVVLCLPLDPHQLHHNPPTVHHIIIHDTAKAYQIVTSIDYGVRSTSACPTHNYLRNAYLLVASPQY